MNDDLTPIEEQVLDAMLAEALGKKAPPDLSKPILARLGETEVSSVESIVRAEEPKRQPKKRPVEKRIAVVMTVIATLAASMSGKKVDLPLTSPLLSGHLTSRLSNEPCAAEGGTATDRARRRLLDHEGVWNKSRRFE